MPKAIDRIVVDIIFCGICLCVSYYAFSSWYFCVPITLILYVAFKITYMHLLVRRKNIKEISVQDMLFALSMMTLKEQRDYFLATIPDGEYTITSDNTYVYNGVAYATLIKFGAPSVDDCAKIVKIHPSISIISRKISKDTLLMAKRMGLYVKQVSLKGVRKYLIAHNAMPKLPTPTKQKHKMDIKAMLANVITRKRAKYYLFSCISTLVLAFILPYKVYYLVCASVFALLGVGCLLRVKSEE